jgi:hypothetical protein
MLFFNNFLKNENLSFNSDTFCHFTNYIGFQYYAVSNLNSSAFSFLKRSIMHYPNVSTFKLKREKLFSSQFRF